MGVSSSKDKSTQTAEVYITQQFSGTCQVTCQNTMSNVSISIIDSTVGGNIEVTQSCATNASCLIGSSMDASADVLFKAASSSNAKNTAELPWYTQPINADTSVTNSRQSIKESISQTTNESCQISSYNQMNNISIFAANSTIGGDISVSQNASTQGQCQLNNSMQAAAYASGQAQNKSMSGKDKKGEKLGDKSGKLAIISFLVIGIVVFVIVSIVGKVISGKSKSSEKAKQEQQAIEARAAAGCPGGLKPIFDPKTGKPVIDPNTKRPVCPPPPLFPPQQGPVIISASGTPMMASAGGGSQTQPLLTTTYQTYGSRGGSNPSATVQTPQLTPSAGVIPA